MSLSQAAIAMLAATNAKYLCILPIFLQFLSSTIPLLQNSISVYQFNIVRFSNHILSFFAVNTLANQIEAMHLLARFAYLVLVLFSNIFSSHCLSFLVFIIILSHITTLNDKIWMTIFANGDTNISQMAPQCSPIAAVPYC